MSVDKSNHDDLTELHVGVEVLPPVVSLLLSISSFTTPCN